MLEASDGAGLAWIYDEAEVIERSSDEAGRTALTVRIAPEKEPLFLRRYPAAAHKD